MIQLEIGGRTYPIAEGEIVLGAGPDAGVPVTGAGVAARHAVVQGRADGGAAIRGAPGADVLVNGVRLGTDPTPLLHGDKLQIGQTEILVVDARRAGQTQIMAAIDVPDGPAVPAPRRERPSAAGRVVCLTDGREYSVGNEALVFGREAGADVVVPGDDVSRRHAEIRGTDAGYVLVDLSANGTYVNGARIADARPLVRGDVIRIGPDEFRFHAPSEGPPPGAVQRLSDTMHGMPATPLPAVPVLPPPIASLLMRSGASKGTRVSLRSPVVSIGRGEYNDVVIADPSVSTMHAKLQRRDGVWTVVDLGSTNGTFMEDERVSDDAPIAPGTTLRFGEVAAMFEPLDEVLPVAGSGTRAVPGVGAARKLGEERLVAKRPVRRQTSRPRERSVRVWVVVTIVLALAAAGAAFLLLT